MNLEKTNTYIMKPSPILMVVRSAIIMAGVILVDMLFIRNIQAHTSIPSYFTLLIQTA